MNHVSRYLHDLILNSFDKGNCLALEQVVLSVSILLIYKNLLIVYLEHVCCNTSLPAAYHQHEQDNNHPLLTPCTSFDMMLDRIVLLHRVESG